jgi:hypothetical protein
MPQDFLTIEAPDLALSFRAELMPDANPDVVSAVLTQLPLNSVLGHVVVSGETIWAPTRIVHLGRNNMVPRKLGSVYLYAPGQTICMCYGRITESANINQFAQVIEPDLPKLQALGAAVWNKSVAQPCREIVNVTIRKAA